MIDWESVYPVLMTDFKGGRLIPHLAILSGALILGIILEVFFGGSLSLFALSALGGVLVDYLAFGPEILEIFTKNKPYLIRGVVARKIRRVVNDREGEFEELWFEMNVQEAHTLHKTGLNPATFPDKEGLQEVEVPESMFLSLKVGQEVLLVCAPDDYVWGIVQGDEVINIES